MSSGKFFRSFDASSSSPRSFSVTPSASRSIPSPPLSQMAFDRIDVKSASGPGSPAPWSTSTPLPPLWAMTLPGPLTAVPTWSAPTWLPWLGPVIRTPASPLPRDSAEAGVGADEVVLDHVAVRGDDADPVARVVCNDIPVDGVVIGREVERDAIAAVAERERAGRIGADEVAPDVVRVRGDLELVVSGDVDPVTGVAADEVGVTLEEAADALVGPRVDDDADPVGDGEGAGHIGADVVAAHRR